MKRLSSATFQLSVAPQSGADATVYWLVPSVTQVKRKADGTHLPEYVSCESKSKTGESSPVSGVGTIRYAIIYLTGETTAETVYQSRIAITPHMAGISFRLYVGGQKLDEKTVLIIDDGGRGDTGDKGPMLYPAGIWDENTTYTATKNAVPFVLFEPGNMFYMMNREKASVVTGGANPAEDYAEHGDNAIWLPFENYRAIFTEILMAKFAKLASAIFWDDYALSQHGKDADGNDTKDYGKFDPAKLDQNDCPFTPNLLIDFLKGKFIGMDSVINGTITSENGRIGGFNIDSYGLTNDGDRDCYIMMRKKDLISGSKYSERIASIGNHLPLSSGRRVVSSMMHTGEEYDEHIVLKLVATGSTQKHNIFGGYANICIDALGGCNWKMSPGDHWCMPGLLGIIRYTCTYANNTYTHGASVVWGNGIPHSISHSLSSDVNHPVIRFNVKMGHTDYTVFGQPFGESARYNRWNLGVNVEALDSSGFSISCWYIEAKVMPGRLDVFVCGRPCN